MTARARPDPDELYRHYRTLYPASRDVVHALARYQEAVAGGAGC